MQEPSHVRIISLVLAFSVIVGGWLLFEFANRPEPIVAPPIETVSTPLPVDPSRDQAVIQPAPIRNDLTITYKCEKAGRLSFSDKPCNPKEKVLAVTATEKEEPKASTDLERMKNSLASMQAERLERERQYAATANSVAVTSTTPSKKSQCEWIDQAIAAKDAELRQLHSAQWGDYLTGERKKLTDERFSLRC